MPGESLPAVERALFDEACADYAGRRYAHAEAGFRAVLERAPDFSPALGNLAELLRATGRSDEAIAAFERALAADPTDALIRNNYGGALIEAGRLDDAMSELERALSFDPEQHRARTNLGAALLGLGRVEEAVAMLEQAVARLPGSAAAHASLGAALVRAGKKQAARPVLERAVALEPRAAEPRATLAGCLVAEGRVDEALQQYREALELRPGLLEAWSPMLLTMHYGAGLSPEAIFDEALRYGRALERSLPADTRAPSPIEPAPRRRLRLGYVSPDLRRHPVGYFLAKVVEAHDRHAFELYAYSDARAGDDVTERLRDALPGFRDTFALSDAALAERIAADGIDVLVDLAGHTTGHRLGVFARRPAPVQVSWLGYPGTTGVGAIGFRITDGVADPPGAADGLHTEALLRLPDCFVAWARPAALAPLGPPPSLAGGSVTFGCFNNAAKLSPRALALWARILDGVPGSRLLLKTGGQAIAGSRERVRARCEAAGLPSARVVFLDVKARPEDGLGDYAGVDLALDPFPYNGTTTTCEALSMGVPLVALRGASHVARVSASILESIGERTLVAESEAEYLAIAVGLALDPARLAALRTRLPERFARAPVGDPARLARQLEGAFRAAFEAHRAGASPRARPSPSVLRDDERDLVPIAGGLEVAVPRAVVDRTSYVLREQGDWCEDELGFVRRAVELGARSLDVGAGFGVHALTLARGAGPSGRVWALEPSPRRAAFVRASAAHNGLPQLRVAEMALPPGATAAPLGESGTVRTVALDDAARELGVSALDFVRLDAAVVASVDGSELVLRAGSPLVMIALGPGGAIPARLSAALAGQGLGAFRLVPGLGVLAPQAAASRVDAFQRYVFFCRPDRAARLAARGLLAEAAEPPSPSPGQWREALARRGWGAALLPHWSATAGRAPGYGAHESALDRYFLVDEATLAPGARLAALEQALEFSAEALAARHTLARRITEARIAAALGLRARAVAALAELIDLFQRGRPLDLDEPFPAPCPRYDAVALGAKPGAWCLAALLEQHERLRADTSFDTGRSAEGTLDTLEQLGFLDEKMARRRELVRTRHGGGRLAEWRRHGLLE